METITATEDTIKPGNQAEENVFEDVERIERPKTSPTEQFQSEDLTEKKTPVGHANTLTTTVFPEPEDLSDSVTQNELAKTSAAPHLDEGDDSGNATQIEHPKTPTMHHPQPETNSEETMSINERPTTPTTQQGGTPNLSSNSPKAHETPKAVRHSVDNKRDSPEPVSPLTPRESTAIAERDSMTSIALSDASLDFDSSDPQLFGDALATPRVSGIRHMRKPSSLEILHNSWGPLVRQSTLFDTDKDQPPETPVENWSHDDTESINERGHLDADGDFDPDQPQIPRSPASSIASSSPIITLNDLRSSHVNSSSTSVRSLSATSSDGQHEVDWSQLDRHEEQEKEDKEIPEGEEDESTAFLLARLEQENAKFSQDPKSAVPALKSRGRQGSRPPSMAHLKKLVQDQNASSVRYSLATDLSMPEEPPPMTELEFWAALVQDYTSTAARLPTLTTTKIRSGIPPPLRGVVWISMAGARDRTLEQAYESLQGEESPYEGIINKDVGRSFPGVELFREAGGEGQKMLGRVLKCYSLHDKDIGYCQGLGFLVGPLLMNMGDREAFCVLVRLMDHFALRPSFLPSLSGLHMRIFQFSSLLKEHNSELSKHLTDLGVEPAYLSQWFLSCFAVTCPLPLLFRIYDVIFAEGANETVMRVAMALMRRNEEIMLASTEFEEVMQLLLGRSLWDPYGGNPDELIDDFTSLGGIITHTKLAELAKEFETQSTEAVGQSAGFLPDVQAAASRFLGRLWSPGHAATASKASTLAPPAAEKEASPGPAIRSPGFFLRRSPSKQSVGTVNENNGSESTQSSSSMSATSTLPTEADAISMTYRESSADSLSIKSRAESSRNLSTSTQSAKEQQELHGQIEDLLTALSEMQREHAQLSAMLQKEREDRNEDHRIVKQIVSRLQPDAARPKGELPKDKESKRHTLPGPEKTKILHQRQASHPGEDRKARSEEEELADLLSLAQTRLNANARFSMSFETKAQLRSKLLRAREQLTSTEAHLQELASKQQTAEDSLTSFQVENEDLKTEVKELRSRVNDEFKRRQKLEHTIREMKAELRSIERKERDRVKRTESSQDIPTLARLETNGKGNRGSVTSAPINGGSGGLRQLRLGREDGRRDSTSSMHSPRLQDTATSPMLASTTWNPSDVDKAVSSTNTEPPLSPFGTTPASAISVSQANPFGRRTTSLVAQDVFATSEHEVVPDEALLLELVNSKTAEAQARQEVDEMRRALNIQKRRNDEAVAQLHAELAAAKEESRKAKEQAESTRAETAPSTPSGKDSDLKSTLGPATASTLPKPSPSPTPPAGSGSVGGWFWGRRTASTNKAVIAPEE